MGPLVKYPKMSTPTVSSQVEDTYNKDLPQTYVVANFRRIGIYSSHSEESLVMGYYKDENGVKRITLDSVDVPLSEFSCYLECLTGNNDRMEQLLYVGIQASFGTGAIMCFILLLSLIFTQ